MPVQASPSSQNRLATRLRELSGELLKIANEMNGTMTSKDAHKLRTSVRRIEVAAEPAGKFKGGKRLQRQLDHLRKMAGHVRDIDVHSELLNHLNAGDYAADCEALKHILLRQREKQEQKAVKAVGGELQHRLAERLEDAALAVESSNRTKPAATKERVEQIRQEFIDFTKEVPQDGDPLHDLRKACKRLRYRLEAIPGRESRSLEKNLKTVQDAIGTWHDWATLAEEAEDELEGKSIAFVAFLRSLTIGKRHEARRSVQVLREKLLHGRLGRKPPTRETQSHTTRHQAAR